MKQLWKPGQPSSRFGLRSDPRTKVFVPSEQIPRPAHCSVLFLAHVVGARLRNPNPEPKPSFWLDVNAVMDRRRGGWEASQKLSKHTRVSQNAVVPLSLAGPPALEGTF